MKNIPALEQARSQEHRIEELERENQELKRVDEIIRKAAAFFRQG